MNHFRQLSIPEQVAAHLRKEVEDGSLQGMMPGVLTLEKELGVNRKTIESALQMLEKEGLIIPQGAGRRRKIALQNILRAHKPLRLAILLYERCDRSRDIVVELQHTLHESGHLVSFTPKSLMELDMSVRRVAKMVEQTEADAWIVMAGSRDVLEWFAYSELKVMAIFGRRRGLPIASVGPDKLPATREATRELLDLGHRRIVFMTRKANRLPKPAAAVRVFLNEMTDYGLTPGSYHLPDWKETVDGFYTCLDSLFHVTPPTAMIVDEVSFLIAIQQFFASSRPDLNHKISLFCTDGSPDFAWCRPMISHIHWDIAPVVSRVVRWASHVSHGKQDIRHVFTEAKFVRGGTIRDVKNSQ